MLLLLSQTPGVIGALACTITLTAPTAVLAPGAATLVATPCTITLSAPAATLIETIGAETNTITLTAQAAAVVPGAVTLAAGGNTITLSSGTAAIAVDQTAVVITVNGTDRSTLVELDTLRIRDILNQAPNTCKFTCYDFTPAEGHVITVSLGSAANLVFAGHILRVNQFYDGIRHNIGFHVECQDYSWMLNRRVIKGQRWTGVSATTIAQQIISTYTTGFTVSNVAAGLDTVAEFSIRLKTPAQALDDLAKAIGGYWYVDYSKDLHFFLTEAADLPDAISDLTKSGDHLTHEGDLAQARTRICGVGAGSEATADLAAGVTSMPVRDGTVFPSAGGSGIVNDNVFTFTSKSTQDGQGGNLIGPLGSPTTPTPAVSTTESGGPLGAVKYWRTDVSEDGESEPSAVSSTVTPATVATPSAITSGAVQHTAAGIYSSTPKDFYTSASLTLTRTGSSFTFTLANAVPGAYVRIFQSTTGGFDGIWPISSVSGTTCTVAGISTSAAASDTAYVSFITDGPLDGTIDYGISFVSPMGETAISSAKQVTAGTHAGVGINDTGLYTLAGGGNLATGTVYYYWFTVTSQTGESSPRSNTTAPSVTLTGGNTAVTLNIPAASLDAAFKDLRANGLNIYRSRSNASTPFLAKRFTREELSAAGVLNNATVLVYTDTLADGALGALPSNNPIGSAIGLWGITTTADVRCTGRRLWRKKGGVWYPLALLGDRDTTTFYLDTTPDSSLGVGFTGADPRPFGGAAVNLTFAAGGAAVLSSNFYRTKASGTKGFYCGSAVAGATTYKDTKADEDLGREMVLTSQRKTLAAATAVRVPDLSKFPASGWFRAGSQVGLYTGRSGSSGEGNLTGVPASGTGALLAPITAGTEIVVEPHLIGIPASGAGSLLYAVNRGDRVNIYVERNDTAAQTALAAREGGDGIHEFPLNVPTARSLTALEEACDAELAKFATRLTQITFRTRDRKIRSGKTITVNLGGTTNLSGTFLISEVVLSEFHIAENTFPLRTVTAAPQQFTFRDLLERVQPV